MKSFRSRDSDKITTKHRKRYSHNITKSASDLIFDQEQLSAPDSPNIVHIELGSPLQREHFRSHSANPIGIIKTDNCPLFLGGHHTSYSTEFIMANTKPIITTINHCHLMKT